MKIVLAVPTYGPTEPDHNRAIRVAIMHAAQNGHHFLGDASPNRQGWEAARNGIVQSVINDTDTYKDEDAVIMWCDSDIILPPDAITRLANHGKDFVTGIYFQRRAPHFPLISTFNGQSFNWIMRWPENVLAPVDGCGFGCVMTSLRMLRKMQAPWFQFRKFSEDFDFCLKAKDAGYQLHVDTGVLCGHLMDPEPATFESFKKLHREFYPIGGQDHATGECDGSTGDLGVSGAPEEGERQSVAETALEHCEVR